MALVWHARRTAARIALRLVLGSALTGAALGAPVLVAATESFTIVSVFPLDIVVDGCEEPIVLSGSLRDVFHVTETNDGGLTLLAVTASANLVGIGLDTGAMYRAVGVTLQPTHMSELEDEFNIVQILTSTFVDRSRIVGTAGALTLEFKTTFHLTKVDSEPVVIWERASITCS